MRRTWIQHEGAGYHWRAAESGTTTGNNNASGDDTREDDASEDDASKDEERGERQYLTSNPPTSEPCGS